ncbi:hypothetical protein [Sphingobium yanoikuyae]|uniref:hypothetical protein n=1 Tax=Sphingobium yanoikuyae TaxID=13690 RepID=UPI0028A89B75|nr:hypothetical protein [Sphingobium yanoikuyae]
MMRPGLIRTRTPADVVAPYPYRSHRSVADLDGLSAGAMINLFHVGENAADAKVSPWK